MCSFKETEEQTGKREKKELNEVLAVYLNTFFLFRFVHNEKENCQVETLRSYIWKVKRFALALSVHLYTNEYVSSEDQPHLTLTWEVEQSLKNTMGQEDYLRGNL